ncbi:MULTISPECIES: CopM family metallochaperone [Methylorubrum]|jgi:uncharacterized protein (DUF305 family)|uniref:DUF305 domain-containing protein n=3 Tax=Methylorubrum TaxID=2282523 RepID=B7KNG1_METC4|nr:MULTISPECIES: DUF305 domain-containing protein [Methylorubrum]ACK81909.1 protein of unknown function DUF305 [Methylorubrum extorquens CM4]MBD8905331.1 DUF305 domain-containing protein [Methylorubrum zatmanii]WHQ70997.1 DUF305 domain-containing protein [Methylorubrum extorquens]GEL41091.1 hypothetical protein MEX01_16820 [Methylorubrum extorquens]
MKRAQSLLTAALLATGLATGLAGAAIAADDMHHKGHQPSASEASDAHQAEMQKMIADMMPSPSDPASTKDFKQADMAMMHDMHVAYTGNPDVDFRTHMIPHHKGAVAMAKVALKHAKDPATKQMAQKIIDDQEKEIAEIQAWLKQNGK